MELIYKQEFYDIKSACIALKIELGLGVLVNFSRKRNTVDIERIPNLI